MPYEQDVETIINLYQLRLNQLRKDLQKVQRPITKDLIVNEIMKIEDALKSGEIKLGI